MCLSIKVHHPDLVLAEGVHVGHEWVVVKVPIGHRCGYVRVGKDHPWYGKDYDSVDADVHGGLTFAEPDVPCAKGGADDGYWVGFDCAHFGDRPDPAFISTEYAAFNIRSAGTIKTQEFVEAECRKLCEQAANSARLANQSAEKRK
jgi:hypothetical protein